jgi:hypothetical protein
MTKILECKLCGSFVHNVSYDAVSVTCSECISDMVKEIQGPRKKKQVASQGYPKGWRFMKEFVHSDGTVYHRGVEQPELKGTLSATVIMVKPKKTKAQKATEKAQVMKQFADLKKQLKKETRKTKIKALETKLRKLQKQL